MSTPEQVRAAAERAVAGEPDADRTVLLERLDRHWPDLLAGLTVAYGDAAPDLAARAAATAVQAFVDRPAELRLLDLRRHVSPDWFQSPGMLGYACYAERFGGDLRGVAERVDYLSELGVTYLHLLPLLQPRPAPDDGGYAVMDHRTVRPDLGTFDDLSALAARLRGRGISLTLDLVLNHVAAEHDWARRARAGEQRYRRYFHVFPDREQPDAFEQALPEVFPDFAPGSFTWDEELAGWVWTTFNSWQWDLNWHEPEVFAEFAELVCFLANAGVECLRLDAIAFLWKRLGTDCQNQPEVHALTAALRAVARIAAPALVFKAEAIVPPQQLAHYLGTGPHTGKVSDLAYHNSLMVQVWSALAARDARLLTTALRRFPPKPPTAAWATYLRCHDDIGWAVDDADAEAVGWTGPGHRAFLSDWYSGAFDGSDARGHVFQHNPATGDRRISGTAASLAGLAAARASGDADGGRARRAQGAARAPARPGLRRRAAAVVRRRARPARRRALGRRAGPRGGQPVGAPAPPAVGPRRAAARARHRGARRVHRPARRGPRPGDAAGDVGGGGDAAARPGEPRGRRLGAARTGAGARRAAQRLGAPAAVAARRARAAGPAARRAVRGEPRTGAAAVRLPLAGRRLLAGDLRGRARERPAAAAAHRTAQQSAARVVQVPDGQQPGAQLADPGERVVESGVRGGRRRHAGDARDARAPRRAALGTPACTASGRGGAPRWRRGGPAGDLRVTGGSRCR